jgi:ketol-acid reductoisomerase
MLKNLTLEKPAIASIGEEIGLKLGNEMVTNYQHSNPSDVFAYEVGRDIVDQILAQPGCQGLRFYNAYNEKGHKTLVYVGLDESGKTITEIAMVMADGSFVQKKGIVADRIRVPGGPVRDGIAVDGDSFIWTVD